MGDRRMMPADSHLPRVAEWRAAVAAFEKPSLPRALWQVVNTLGLYALLWYLMYLSVSVSWWLTVPLVVAAGALLVRVFIIFHDCGHGSFFRWRWANHVLGFVTGVLTFTPFYHWRWEHARHHATAGDLDRRGTGDIWTMTVREYLESSCWRRFAYRLARNPFVLFVVAPLVVFIVRQRFPSAKANARERRSVWVMNIALAGMVAAGAWVFGPLTYVLLQLGVVMVAGAAGVWLFYVQHQFEDAYWERHEQWDYTRAALEGSSFYKLPRVLQWLSGNIGYHHIHHLSPRIPNYNLQRCHEAHPIFRQVRPITLTASLRSLGYRLWDERRRRLVGFGYLRRLSRRRRRLGLAAPPGRAGTAGSQGG